MADLHPASVTIATTLHDTLFDFGLLSVQEILCFIGDQADVLLFNQDDKKDEDEKNNAIAATEGALATGAGGGAGVMSGGLKPPAPRPIGVGDLMYDAEKDGAANNTLLNQNDDGDDDGKDLPDEPGRRKKVEGPMRAAGQKMTFSDSSDDDDDNKEAEEEEKNDSKNVPADVERSQRIKLPPSELP